MSASQNRAEQIRAKAQRLAAAATQTAPPDEIRASSSKELRSSVGGEAPAAAPAGTGRLTTPSPVRTRPVRLSVDIAPNEHTELARLALAAAAELGVVRVHGQEIVRAILRRYLNDPHLQRDVLADIRDERRAR